MAQAPEIKRKAGARPASADPGQYQRFLDAARELGCEENAERMEEVVRRAAKMPPPRKGEGEKGEGG